MLNFFRKKPSEGDRLLAKLHAIASGAEKAELNKCANCGTQLETINLVDWITVYCDPCKALLRTEQLANAALPQYDIDEILAKDSAFDIVDAIAWRTESDSEHRSIPWDLLLPPEAVCRAFSAFDNAMGNGFATLLEYGGGPETFIRGHNAIAAVGAEDVLKITSEAKKIVESHGITFPDSIPQDWWSEDEGIDYGLYEKLNSELNDLDSQYWSTGTTVRERIVEHVRDHVATLRIRKPT